MKRVIPAVLLAAVLILVAVLIFRDRGAKGPPFQFTALYDEACSPVVPESGGDPWPEESLIESLRSEWSSLGARDSTILDELMRDWVYPANTLPLRATNANQTPTGLGLGLEERLALGDAFRRHPRWRVGSARYFPGLSLVLTSTEKHLIAELRSTAPDTVATAVLAEKIDLPVAEVQSALSGLAGVGWVVPEGQADSLGYRLARPEILNTALQVVTFTPAQGRSMDLASITAAFQQLGAPIQRGSVRLSGPCSQTGKCVIIDLVEGKLRRGRPGSVWAATVTPPGLTNGLFSSKLAWIQWEKAHPEAKAPDAGPLVQLYQTLAPETP